MVFYVVMRKTGLYSQSFGAFTRECDATRKVSELNGKAHRDWCVENMSEWEVKFHNLMIVFGCGC